MVGPGRPVFVLFGSSIVQYSFSNGGWGAILADVYARKADILLRGYVGWNSRRALQVVDKIFPKLTHDTIILCEGLTAFARLNSQLEDKVQTANAQAEVTEELLYTVEEQEKKNQEKITLLEARLASLEIQQKKDKEEFEKLKADYQKEMESGESALNEERGKRQKAEKSTQEMKDELSTIETQAQKAASRALIEFRESKEYEDELVKGSADAYQLRFKDCEKAISRLQPKLDLSGLQADNLPDKEGSKSDKKADAMEDHPLSS